MPARKGKEPIVESPSTGTAESSRRPEVIVEVLFDRGMLFIAVNNIGDGAAYKISVNFNKKIVGLGGQKEISALALLKNLEFLGPNREVKILLDTSHSYFQRKQPAKVSARISYKDSGNRKYEATINHDLEIYRDLPYSTLNPDCCD
jgi:hypothetical protein